MTRLDWEKVHRTTILNKEEKIPPYIKDKGAINAYMGIVNTISKIENKDWLKKSLKKQERNKKTLYRTLNRHIEELVAVYVQFIDKKSMLSL